MTKNQTPSNKLVQTSGDKKAPAVTTRRCNCGCGEATSSSKTLYKPGHDARHASAVALRIVENNLHGQHAQAVLEELPTNKLQHKAGEMVARRVEAAKVKAQKANQRQARKDEKAKRAGALLDALAADPQALLEAGQAAQVRLEEERYNAEQAAKRAEAEAAIQEDEAEKVPSWTEGTVKVGRWEYPSRTWGEVVQRNTKRDGSGEWVNL